MIRRLSARLGRRRVDRSLRNHGEIVGTVAYRRAISRQWDRS